MCTRNPPLPATSARCLRVALPLLPLCLDGFTAIRRLPPRVPLLLAGDTPWLDTRFSSSSASSYSSYSSLVHRAGNGRSRNDNNEHADNANDNAIRCEPSSSALLHRSKLDAHRRSPTRYARPIFRSTTTQQPPRYRDTFALETRYRTADRRVSVSRARRYPRRFFLSRIAERPRPRALPFSRKGETDAFPRSIRRGDPSGRTDGESFLRKYVVAVPSRTKEISGSAGCRADESIRRLALEGCDYRLARIEESRDNAGANGVIGNYRALIN